MVKVTIEAVVEIPDPSNVEIQEYPHDTHERVRDDAIQQLGLEIHEHDDTSSITRVDSMRYNGGN